MTPPSTRKFKFIGCEIIYREACYLEMGICDEQPFIEEARDRAVQRAWEFELRKGDLTLLQRLFTGQWDQDFVVVPPGGTIVARHDASVLEAIA